jgi:hypothetical protein
MVSNSTGGAHSSSSNLTKTIRTDQHSVQQESLENPEGEMDIVEEESGNPRTRRKSKEEDKQTTQPIGLHKQDRPPVTIPALPEKLGTTSDPAESGTDQVTPHPSTPGTQDVPKQHHAEACENG